MATSRPDPLPLVLLALTATTGLVDAVSYLGLGRIFTANMTGNVVLLGFAATGVPGLSVVRSSLSLTAFLVGAGLGGRLGQALAEGPVGRWLLAAFGLEAALLVLAGVSVLGLGADAPDARLYPPIALTALAMGLRNATVRRLGVADLTTTVLTLTVTAIAADSRLAGGDSPRLARRIGAVVAMAGGAAAGALLLRLGLAIPLFVAAACVLVIAGGYALTPASTQPR